MSMRIHPSHSGSKRGDESSRYLPTNSHASSSSSSPRPRKRIRTQAPSSSTYHHCPSSAQSHALLAEPSATSDAGPVRPENRCYFPRSQPIPKASRRISQSFRPLSRHATPSPSFRDRTVALTQEETATRSSRALDQDLPRERSTPVAPPLGTEMGLGAATAPRRRRSASRYQESRRWSCREFGTRQVVRPSCFPKSRLHPFPRIHSLHPSSAILLH